VSIFFLLINKSSSSAKNGKNLNLLIKILLFVYSNHQL